MKNLNNKGFAAIEGALIAIIVAVIAGVGYYVWKQSSADNSGTPQRSVTVPAQKEEEQPEKKETSSADYLTIEDWGIKIKMRDAEKVSIKVTNKSGDLGYDQDGKFVGYASPSFKKQYIEDDSCAPGVSLYRSSGDQKSFYTQHAKKIGDYYYWITGGPGPCSDHPKTDPDDILKNRFLSDFDTDNISVL
jgi:hypothetical protein